jgi:hypothetical protein
MPVGFSHSTFQKISVDRFSEDLTAYGECGQGREDNVPCGELPYDFQRINQGCLSIFKQTGNGFGRFEPFFLFECQPDFFHLQNIKKADTVTGLSKIGALMQLFRFVGIFNEMFEGHGHGRSFRSRSFNVGS